MSVGSTLEEMRKSAGFTIEQIARLSRIPTSVIADLEHDNFSSAGGATYARGHIKTIARICGVGDSDLLIKFESQTIPLRKSIRDLLSENHVLTPKKERKPISWTALGGVVAVLFIFALVGTAITSIQESPEQNIITAPSNNEDQSPPSAAIRDDVEVKLKAVNGLSWIAIRDSTGRTQFSGRIHQGEERTFTDNQLLYLVMGNAGAINLTVNGEDIGVVGAVGEVLRLEFGPQASNQG